MITTNRDSARDIIEKMFGICVYDEESSRNAGYSIFRSPSEYLNYYCDLGKRFEVNKSDGTSFNIWLEEKDDIVEKAVQYGIELARAGSRESVASIIKRTRGDDLISADMAIDLAVEFTSKF